MFCQSLFVLTYKTSILYVYTYIYTWLCVCIYCTLNIIYRECWLTTPSKQYKSHNEEEKTSLFFFQIFTLGPICPHILRSKTPSCSIKYLKLMTVLFNHLLAVKSSVVITVMFCTIHIPAIKTSSCTAQKPLEQHQHCQITWHNKPTTWNYRGDKIRETYILGQALLLLQEQLHCALALIYRSLELCWRVGTPIFQQIERYCLILFFMLTENIV